MTSFDMQRLKTKKLESSSLRTFQGILTGGSKRVVPKTFEGLRDKMIAEQFLKCCSPKLVVFIREQDCKTTKEMAGVSDRFLEAQSLRNSSKKTLKGKLAR